MFSETVLTPIDKLMDLLKKNKELEIKELSRLLNEKKETIENWVLILEEKKVLNIETKWFNNFVSLNDDEINTEFDFFNLKNTFLQKAKAKEIPYSKITELWLNFINHNEQDLYEKFKITMLKNGKGKNIESKTIWKKFRKELEVL